MLTFTDKVQYKIRVKSVPCTEFSKAWLRFNSATNTPHDFYGLRTQNLIRHEDPNLWK
jgi:hypothetical protein